MTYYNDYYSRGIPDYKYYGKYIGVYSRNYIGIYVDEYTMREDLKYYDDPVYEHFNTKYEAACYIQEGLYYDLNLYHITLTSLDRLNRIAVNHKHFTSFALESWSDRYDEKKRLVNERREKKKKGLNS